MSIFDVLTLLGGLFLFGMDTMTQAVSGLADVPEFQQMFIMFKNHHPPPTTTQNTHSMPTNTSQ